MVDIPQEFQRIVRSGLPFADSVEFSAEDGLAELGLDSMSVIQLLADLEDFYGLEFPDDALHEETFATVGSLWLTVSALLADCGRVP
jgi:acyl carrier protein